MCEIQLKYGEEYLSKTCLTYPRVFNIVDQQVDLSGNMSCPETARLALLNQELMQFDVVEEMLDVRHIIKQKIETKQSVWNSCFWEIRTFTIEILQNRSYSISDRLIFLGLFCEKLASVSSSKNRSQIDNVVTEFRLDSSDTVKEISKLPQAYHVQLSILKEILQTQTNIHHSRLRNYNNEALQAFDFELSDKDAIQSNYIKGCNEFYVPFINEHSYILENYLVNHVFHRLFLFKEGSNILEEYLRLTMLFCTVRFYLQGVAVFEKKMTPVKAVDIIQAFSKSIEHSSNYLNLLFIVR